MTSARNRDALAPMSIFTEERKAELDKIIKECKEEEKRRSRSAPAALLIESIGVFMGLTPAQWSDCHRYFLWFWIVACFVIATWLGIGGIRDGISFIRDLRSAKRDFSDDGTVSKANNDE